MAIVFDNSTTNHTVSSATATYAFTVGSGTDRALLVGFTANKAVLPAITGVTYNGVAMTACSFSPQALPTDSTVKVYLYYLLNPSTGSNNVVITFASAPDEINSNAVSYSGVASVGIDTHTNGTGTSATLTATTTADASWVVGIARNNSDGNGGAGTGTTRRSFISGQNGFYDTGGGKTPGGSYSISSTFGSAEYGALGMVLTPIPGVNIDAVTQVTQTASGSFSHTTSGTNRALFVIVHLRTPTSGDSVSVTYNGVSMSTGISVDFASTGSKKCWIFYLANPTSGANNVATTFTGASESVVTAISFTGVSQSLPFGATGSNTTASASSLTTNITTTKANSWILDALNEGGSTPFTPGTGQTQQWGAATTINGMTGYGSTKPTTTAGVTSTSWTLNSAAAATLVSLEILAVSVSSTLPSPLITRQAVRRASSY